MAALTGVTSARGDDKVSIDFLSVSRTASTENVRIEIVRDAPPDRDRETEVDRFFSAIQRVLRIYEISENWQLGFPETPLIKISIELNGKKIVLASSHTILEESGKLVVTEHGAEALSGRDKATVLAQQSLRRRNYRAAFEQLLQLSTDHLHKTLIY